MRSRLSGTFVAATLVVLGIGTATAQTPTTAPQGTPASGGPAVANPTYASIPMEIAVNRPAAEVWKRIGEPLRHR